MVVRRAPPRLIPGGRPTRPRRAWRPPDQAWAFPPRSPARNRTGKRKYSAAHHSPTYPTAAATSEQATSRMRCILGVRRSYRRTGTPSTMAAPQNASQYAIDSALASRYQARSARSRVGRALSRNPRWTPKCTAANASISADHRCVDCEARVMPDVPAKWRVSPMRAGIELRAGPSGRTRGQSRSCRTMSKPSSIEGASK
jgi:hypothetical protein